MVSAVSEPASSVLDSTLRQNAAAAAVAGTLDAVCHGDTRLPCPGGIPGGMAPVGGLPGGSGGVGGGGVVGGEGGPMSAMWSILHAYQYANFAPFPFPPRMAR